MSGALGIVEPILLTSMNSIMYTKARDHKPSEQGILFSKMSLFLRFHIIQHATRKISNSGEINLWMAASMISIDWICKGKLKEFQQGA